MMGLTPQQAKCLDAINESIARRGMPPTFREMANALGVHSTARIQALLRNLEERGHIRRLKHKRRAIEVMVPYSTCPYSTCPHCGKPLGAMS